MVDLNRKSRILRSEAGQGVLEYMLLLVIIIVLILGLSYQFNTAFRAFAEGFFDGYISCLIETGELPGVSQQCMEEFADFDLSKGQNMADGNLGGGSDDGSSSGDGAGGDGERGSRGDQVAAGGESLATGGNTSRVSFAQLGSERGRQETVRMEGAGGEGEKDNNNQSSKAIDSVQIGHVSQNTSRRSSVAMNYGFGYDDEEEEKETRPTAAKVGQVEPGGSVLRANQTSINSEIERSTATIKDSEPFSIGRLLRMLIIICIIIAMIVFFGGQLLQISKSREKG